MLSWRKKGKMNVRQITAKIYCIHCDKPYEFSKVVQVAIQRRVQLIRCPNCGKKIGTLN